MPENSDHNETLDDVVVGSTRADHADSVDTVAPRPVDADAVQTRRDTTDEDTVLNLDLADEETRVVEAPAEQTAVLDRDALREERNRQLGVVSTTREVETTPAPLVSAPAVKRTTDKWHGSLALFLLRLVSGLVVGAHGVQRLMHLTATKEFFGRSVLPRPDLFALGFSIAEVAVGVLLVLGLLTRVAGLLLAVLAIGMLAVFVWGKVNPFEGHTVGFNGELELLLAGLGLAFLLLGGGGWAVDNIFRRNRAKRREARELGQI